MPLARLATSALHLQAEGACSSRDHCGMRHANHLITCSDRGRVSIYTLLASTPTMPAHMPLSQVSLCKASTAPAAIDGHQASDDGCALSSVWSESDFEPSKQQRCRLGLRTNVCRVPQWEERVCPQSPEVDPPSSSSSDCVLVLDQLRNRCRASRRCKCCSVAQLWRRVCHGVCCCSADASYKAALSWCSAVALSYDIYAYSGSDGDGVCRALVLHRCCKKVRWAQVEDEKTKKKRWVRTVKYNRRRAWHLTALTSFNTHPDGSAFDILQALSEGKRLRVDAVEV